MYFAYGWPHTYDTGLGAGPDTEVVACLSTSEHLLLVCRGVVQVWSSGRHRLLLGEVWLRDAGEDGDSCISAAWQEDRRRLVLLTERAHVIQFALHQSPALVWSPPGGLALHRVQIHEQRRAAPFEERATLEEAGAAPPLSHAQPRPVCVLTDARGILVCCEDASVVFLAWSGMLRGVAEGFAAPEAGSPNRRPLVCARLSAVSQSLVLLFADGRCGLARLGPLGAGNPEELAWAGWAFVPSGPGQEAVALALNESSGALAVGLANGEVLIFAQAGLEAGEQIKGPAPLSLPSPRDTPSQPGPSPPQRLSAHSFDGGAAPGAARCLEWSPEGGVLAVGHSADGLAVWTAHGCRLLATGRQGGDYKDSGSTRGPLERGVLRLVWGPLGYSLFALEAGTHSASLVCELTFAHACDSNQRAAAVFRGLEGRGAPACRPASGASRPACTPRSEGGSARPGLLRRSLSSLSLSSDASAAPAAPGEEPPGGGAPLPPQADVLAVLGAGRVLLLSQSGPLPRPEALALDEGVRASLPGSSSGFERTRDWEVRHAAAPQAYLEHNYPLRALATSPYAPLLAVAGRRGLALMGQNDRWRLFGSAQAEAALGLQSMAWLPDGLLAAVSLRSEDARGASKDALAPVELVVLDSSHLDGQAVRARLALDAVPVTLDALPGLVLLAYAPMEFEVVGVRVARGDGKGGEATGAPSSLSAFQARRPAVSLSLLRKLSLVGMVAPLARVALLDPALDGQAASRPASRQVSIPEELPRAAPPEDSLRRGHSSAAHLALPAGPPAVRVRPSRLSSAGSQEALWRPGSSRPQSLRPLRCLVLRAGGALSLLDLISGQDAPLAEGVERFWAPLLASDCAPRAWLCPGLGSGALEEAGSLANVDVPPPPAELPWWVYARGGLAAIFPGACLAEPGSSHRGSLKRGPQAWLEPVAAFDPENWPVGLSLAQGALVCVGPRLMRKRGARRQLQEGEARPDDLSRGCLDDSTNDGFPPSSSPSQPPRPAVPTPSPPSFRAVPAVSCQPLLPALLRHLLLSPEPRAAAALLAWLGEAAPLARSLEWLLLGALEEAGDERAAARKAAAAAAGRRQRVLRERGGGGRGLSSLASGTASLAGGEVAWGGAWTSWLPRWRDGKGEDGEGGEGALARQQSFLIYPNPSFSSPRHPYDVARTGTDSPLALASPGALASPHSLPRAGPAARLLRQVLALADAALGSRAAELVLALARKTEGELWPALCEACGAPSRLCRQLLLDGEVERAAWGLVVVQELQGPGPAQELALEVADAALHRGGYELFVGVVRFLLPMGAEEEANGGGEHRERGERGGASREGGERGGASRGKDQESASAERSPALGEVGWWNWLTQSGQPAEDAGPSAGSQSPTLSPAPPIPPHPQPAPPSASGAAAAFDRASRAAWALLAARRFGDLARLGAALEMLALPGWALGPALVRGAEAAPHASVVQARAFEAAGAAQALRSLLWEVRGMLCLGASAGGESEENEAFRLAPPSAALAAAASDACALLLQATAAAGCVNEALAAATLLQHRQTLALVRALHSGEWKKLRRAVAEDATLSALEGVFAAVD